MNLDELAAVKRTLAYKGVEHEVLDLDVDSFIAFQGEFEELLKREEAQDVKGTFEMAKAILARCVPTFSAEDVAKLNMRQLMAAIQLVADFYPEVSEDASGND